MTLGLTITAKQMNEALKYGESVIVIINGEYYDYKNEEEEE